MARPHSHTVGVLVGWLALLTLCSGPAGAQVTPRQVVWEEPVYGQPSPAMGPFVAELRGRVRGILAAGHLAPLWYTGGIIDPWGSTAWGNPGEVVWALSDAIPYLDPGLRAKTVGYLEREMALYTPWQSAEMPALEGRRRTSYRPVFWRYTDNYLVKLPERRPWMWPRNDEDLAADPPRAGGFSGLPENLYALYLYARTTGRWSLPAEHWKQLAGTGKGLRPRSAGELAGLIAYARIARRLGHEVEATDAGRRAEAALRGAESWASFTRSVGGVVDRHDHVIRFPGLYNLTPEVGRFLASRARPELARALSPVLENPLWYLTREHGGYGENHFLGPDFTWALFQTRAYVFGDRDLESKVDLPWVELGDLYYLQKLVALLRTHSPVTWRVPPMRAKGSAPSGGRQQRAGLPPRAPRSSVAED